MASLLYVMGRGHSGSTVLDALLANAHGATGLGELVAGIRRYEYPCGCGETFGHCPFWREVRRRFEDRSGIGWDEGAALVQAQAHVGRFAATRLARLDAEEWRNLRRTNDAIMRSVREVADASLVVDSSKELTRALWLARSDPGVVFVHLVRSPHAVVASLMKRLDAGKGFSFLRRRYRGRYLAPFFVAATAAGWVLGNLMAEFVRIHAPGRVERIRYEDLCAAPRTVLERIGRMAGIEVGEVADAIKEGRPLEPQHQVAGNRMLRSGAFVFQPERSGSWSLPWYYSILTTLLTWPLLLLYRYSLRGKAPN